MLTVNTFPGGRRHITGNRCEKGLTGGKKSSDVPNMMAYKLKRVFDYEPLDKSDAPRGVIGIPRVLNIYENFPFWAVFFKELGYSVVLSPESDKGIYELGIESIPSESECYPAKLSHGHVQWLIDNGVKTIFHPSVFFEHKETDGAQNNFNCPMVIGYPENLKNNVEAITDGEVRFLRPFISFANESVAEKRLVKLGKDDLNIPAGEIRAACRLAWAEMQKCREDIKAEGQRALRWMEEHGGRGIVLAGRPYHVDPEINHGIPELITSYGLTVLTEDSITPDFKPERPVRVNDQWVFHSRLYTAAEFVKTRDDLEIIQLNSFGCGLDAVTTDQVSEILEGSGKLYTLLKIDEVNNLGAARIRVRSLIAAMNMRRDRGIRSDPKPSVYKRTVYTKKMQEERWTILAPQMSPIHFDLLQPVFNKHGYNVEILKNDNRTAIDMGLKYVNNDACFPSLIVVGQIMDAILSGKYDTDRLAVMMTQTGGCCRASNYVAFIRRALDKAGLSHIPVISLNANGMEKNPGFKTTLPMLTDAGYSLVLGDLLMKCLYRVRPYELVPGSANELHSRLREKCVRCLTEGRVTRKRIRELCSEIVREFDEFPIDEELKKPRVGIVGEILVKYMPLANNNLVDLLEREGAEAEVPGLMSFLMYGLYNSNYKHEFLGGKLQIKNASNTGIRLLEWLNAPANDALRESRRFEPALPISEIAGYAKPYISIGNQYGEGWFLTGEMVELIHTGAPNIVCIQPFACLPNHVVGKGVIKALRTSFPQANIVAVDYDPGASEVNQLNRIKLMLSAAVKNLEAESSAKRKEPTLRQEKNPAAAK
jgi:predicted nucleotide-binding protein (sugar kinase/HSP70/actin superfamily)